MRKKTYIYECIKYYKCINSIKENDVHSTVSFTTCLEFITNFWHIDLTTISIATIYQSNCHSKLSQSIK